MRLLIKSGIILEPNAPHNGKQRDLFIENGIIQQIAESIDTENVETLDAQGCHIFIGCLDIGTYLGDPGFEHREDMVSMAQAAVAGGFTAIASLPNTHPSIHSKSEVQYLKTNAASELIDLYPIGAISKNCAGEELAELYDMQQAGAVAFSDGVHAISRAGVLLRALDYTKTFDGLVINHPHDKTLIPDGQMHEGKVSTSLGLRGIPSISEEMMLERDIQLLDYTQSKLHVLNVSSAKSVALIRAAKARGLNITASVAALNLTHTDENLSGFEAQLKVQPPLRSEADRQALIAGLEDGTIDCITTNHRPLEPEAKKRAFSNADFGAIGLETTLAHLHTQNILPLPQLVEKLAYQPRKVLNLESPSIQKGHLANLIIFNSEMQWIYTTDMIRSKSRNTPFIGESFTGKVVAVVNKARLQRVE